MIHHYCVQCGAGLNEAAHQCPTCGVLTHQHAPGPGAEPDPRDLRIRQLLAEARACQHRGDLDAALRHAREALSLDHDCSTIHALLGHLYEQSGNTAAARYHFQSALNVSSSCGETPVLSPVPPAPFPLRHPQRKWIPVVLAGCVLFSGLAVFLSFWPMERHVGQGTVMQTPTEHPKLPAIPRWTWKVPTDNAPVPHSVQGEKADPIRHVTPTLPEPKELRPLAPSGVVPVAVSTPIPVLGPSPHARVLPTVSNPTVAEADQAYFRGQYDQAITLYEELLRREERPNPRLYQDLAWCYQQLGNSQEAADHLRAAMQGYQAILAEDPQHPAALQGLKSCTAALETLTGSRAPDRPTTPR